MMAIATSVPKIEKIGIVVPPFSNETGLKQGTWSLISQCHALASWRLRPTQAPNVL
jgi:hypothetical protein